MPLYSPLPMSAYKLEGVDPDVTSSIAQLDLSEAVWNLFWASNWEALEKVPGSGQNWYKFYTPTQGGKRAVIDDVYNDETLFKYLSLPPQQFHDWFRDEDASIYDAYYVYGEDAWKERVLAATDFSARSERWAAPVRRREGTVVYAEFRRRA